MKLTEKEIKKLCKKAGCYCPLYHEILGKYVDTPEYLRQYIEGLGKKEIQKKLKKIIEWLEKEEQKQWQEAKEFHKKDNEKMEHNNRGIIVGLELVKKKIENLLKRG